MICIGDHVGGHTLALRHGSQNCRLLVPCQRFDSYSQMCCNRYYIIFSIISLKFKCKISVQKGVIHSFKSFKNVNIKTRNDCFLATTM